MKTCRSSKMTHANAHAVMSLGLWRYDFPISEIRMLMRQTLGNAVSGRTIKRLVRSTGRKMKRGRPRSTPRIRRGDLCDLIELTARGLESAGGNALQFFHEIQLQFGLTPRQYLRWVAKCVRRGKCMMRRCLLCGCFFSSLDSGERHCGACQVDRRRLVNEERRSSFV
jgi:hypothetical protein